MIICFYSPRRRSTASPPKSTPSTASTSAVKKNVSSPTPTNSTTLKSGLKSSDKAPLLEPASTAPPPPVKRKLIPERTVQISDVNTSRFKSALAATTTTTSGQATTTTATTTGKEVTSTSSDPPASSSTTTITSKPVLTAADSGIYGADLSDEVPPVTKIIASADPPKIYGIDLPDKSNPTTLPSPPPVIVVVNPLSETSTTTTTPTKSPNTTLSAIVVPNNVPINPRPKEEHKEEIPLSSFSRIGHVDETIKSAYSNLIDATMSENEGTIASSSVVSSASQSRRTSNTKQPLISHESNNTNEAMSRKPTPFNPLHVILKKDANKYYTTEYI